MCIKGWAGRCYDGTHSDANNVPAQRLSPDDGNRAPAARRESGEATELAHSLVRMALVSTDQQIRLDASRGRRFFGHLSGGHCPSGVICVKRALPRLKVAADWRVPVERNRFEVEWMRVAGRHRPGRRPGDPGRGPRSRRLRDDVAAARAVPGLEDAAGGRRGTVATAAAVGDVLGRIHAATADRPDIAARFPTDALFHAIRLDPYLVDGRARASGPGARSCWRWSATTARTRRVLVHGDFSPKNILVGPGRPGHPRRRVRVVRRSGLRSSRSCSTTCC